MKPLQLLIIEDSEDDALLMLHELRQGGYQPDHRRVDNPEALVAALTEQPWDLVLSDFRLPRFDGLDALRIVHSISDVPFILVSGVIGEETAVAAMKAGASDYVLKDRLVRLVPAVERELREAEVRRQRRQAEAALRDSEERFRLATEAIGGLVYELDVETQMVRRSPGLLALVGYRIDEVPPEVGWWEQLVHPDDRVRFQQRNPDVVAQHATVVSSEYRVRHKEGHYLWVWDNARLAYDENGKLTRWIGCTVSIDARKQAEEQLRRFTVELEQRVAQRTAELARSNAQLRAEIAERQRLEEAIQQTAENEKQRLGRDLHDGLGQYLVALNLHASTIHHRLRQQKHPEAAELEKMGQRIGEALELTRRLARGLYPASLEREGLGGALREMANNLSDLFRVPCHFQPKLEPQIPDKNVERQLYRIAQEAAVNAAKHAQAKRIQIALESAPNGLCLRVQDNGTGLVPRAVASEPSSGGMGTSIMRYRAKTIGATLSIRSKPGQGTTVECFWPGLAQQKQHPEQPSFPDRLAVGS